MTTVARVLLALLALNILVTIHEFGHFIVAKLVGVKVNEFAIGMGPKLISWGKKETLYSIRIFPIGGFCAMEGEDEDAPTPSALGGNADREVAPDVEIDESRSFAKKKVWQRVLIVIAGAAMNLLLGFVLLLVFNGFLQKPQEDGKVWFATTTISKLSEESAAYKSGLRPGDTIVEVNGRRILMYTDLAMEMQNDADGKMQMVVSRPTNGTTKNIALKSVEFDIETVTVVKDGKITTQRYLRRDFYVDGIERNFWNTITYSAKQEVSVATMIWRSLVDLIQGDYGVNDLSGPVGTVDVIADVVGDTVSNEDPLIAWQNLVFILILITVNLGVFNLLPLPALDGGRLVFLILEGITRKPVPQKYEALVHFVGIILLLLLMVLVTYSDVTKLFA